MRGESINGITRELQVKGVRAPVSNKVVTRSTVASVLRNARRYAGIWHWGEYELSNLIPARISEEQAEQKRKWLTSRVFCGMCGHRYALNARNSCVCYRSDPIVAQPPCENIRISWRRLSFVVWHTFLQAMTDFHALELCVKDKWHAWKLQKTKIDKQVKTLEEQMRHLEQKRRLYSWQQAEGIISEEELQAAFKQEKSEESVIDEQLDRLEQFRHEPAPMDMATFKQLAEIWSVDIAYNLANAPDDVRTKFAETFDLHATIHPDGSQNGYHVDLTANISLEMDGNKLSAYDMVFRSSERLSNCAYNCASANTLVKRRYLHW